MYVPLNSYGLMEMETGADLGFLERGFKFTKGGLFRHCCCCCCCIVELPRLFLRGTSLLTLQLGARCSILRSKLVNVYIYLSSDTESINF